MARQTPETSAECSQHAERHTARRNITPEALEYVLTSVRRMQRTGATFYLPLTARCTSS